MKLFISTRVGLQEWIVTARINIRVKKIAKKAKKARIESQSKTPRTKATKVTSTTMMKTTCY